MAGVGPGGAIPPFPVPVSSETETSAGQPANRFGRSPSESRIEREKPGLISGPRVRTRAPRRARLGDRVISGQIRDRE